MKLPDFAFEIPLWEKGFSIIGIDEVGRGAFAGPVAVGGVVFSPVLQKAEKDHLLALGINDSKKLSKKKREELSLKIKNLALGWYVSFIGVDIINKIGIGKAVFLGMSEVISQFQKTVKKPYLLIDAFEIPGQKLPQKGIVRGDSLSISIASASIIAKVTRDTFMESLGLSHPQYGWEKNKGYGTLKHRKAILEFGKVKFHRKEFCRKIVPDLLFEKSFSTI